AYEMATVTEITPYDRLPQITLDGVLPVDAGGLKFSYSTEFVRFERDLRKGMFTDEDGATSPWYDTRIPGLARANGNRIHVEPGVSLPLDWSYGFIKPSVKYLYTQYDLDLDQQGKNTLLAGQEFNSSEDRSVPIFSVDSGLYFDRNTELFGNQYKQTLEPRLFYL
ncbi:Uncharacterized protein APZ42_001814, partial [Daphnia magna]